MAAWAGHQKAFTYLVDEAGLNPEGPSARREACLWLAAASGRVSTILPSVWLQVMAKAGTDAMLRWTLCSPAVVFVAFESWGHRCFVVLRFAFD